MSNEKAMIRALQRCCTAYPNRGTRPSEIDRAIAPERVSSAVRRKLALMGTPAEFRGLPALAAKAFDRPGVDEFADPLGYVCHLGVALRYVDHFDTKP